MNTNTFPAFERSEIQDTPTLKHLKHLKHLNLLLLAALAIVLTQCKKPILQSLNSGGTVSITLSVDGNSKLTVTPDETAATVAFESGDAIYVASDGKYVGTLYHDGTNFKGDITGATTGVPLYFYFLGNRTPSETLSSSITTLTVDISDQSASLPVISYAASNENYSSSVTSYTAELKNQCGLVKFTTSDYTGDGNLSVKKMNNKVTVTLSDHSFAYDKVSDVDITLNEAKSKEGEREYWAILLPNESSVIGDTDGDVYSSDGWTGKYGEVPAVSANSYLTAGVAIKDGHEYVDLGLSVKWATCNVGASSPEGYGDYFAWGATDTWYSSGGQSTSPVWKSGYSDGYTWAHCPHTSGTYSTSNKKVFTKYVPKSKASTYAYDGVGDDLTTLESSDDAASANWGGSWRMPTMDDWQELYGNCTWEWTDSYNSKGVSGYVVTGKKEDYTDKSIFLPAAGYRNGTSLYLVGSFGLYWSSSLYSSSPSYAYYMCFNSGYVSPQYYDNRCYGYTVRPVQ